MPMSILVAHNYLERGGTACPYCGSGNISGEECEFDAGAMYQNISCSACSAQWVDKYILNDILECQEAES